MIVNVRIETRHPHSKTFFTNHTIDDSALAGSDPVHIVVDIPCEEGCSHGTRSESVSANELEEHGISLNPYAKETETVATGLGLNKDPRSQYTRRYKRKGAIRRSRSLLGRLCGRSMPWISGDVSGAGTAGNDKVTKRQHYHANGSILRPYLPLASEFRALIPRTFVQLPGRAAQQEDQACHVNDHASSPSLCTLALPTAGSGASPEDKPDEGAAFREQPLIMQTPYGRMERLTASMDTCADGINAIAKHQAESLGFTWTQDKKQPCSLRVAGNQNVKSLGKVVVRYKLPCQDDWMNTEFHVFDDLAGHRAILSVSLTIELRHIYRRPCEICDTAGD